MLRLSLLFLVKEDTKMKDALEYEQISDDLMILDGQSAVLRFNVKLYSRNLNGSAEPFHKEFLQPRKRFPNWFCSIRKYKIFKHTIKVRFIKIRKVPKD